MSDKSIPEPLLHHCEKRWIQCKKRQEQRERYMGRRATADRHLEAIEGKLRTYRWMVDDLGPEYPDRRAVGRATDTEKPVAAAPATRPSGVVAHLGPLTISVFPAAKRINIVSAETGAVARVDVSTRSVSSGDVEVITAADGVWAVPPWDLSVAFASNDTDVVVRCGDGEWKYAPPSS
jgi:hypothetical protein